MPKKGKKGSGKLANMTEEERILHESDLKKEEENLKKKQEQTLTQYLKMKLLKEEKAALLNLYKLNHQWRNIMREAKSRELRKDIEILSQTFERIVDRKDSVLKSLTKDISEADEQYLVSLRSHMDTMDELINTHSERITNLQQEYDIELQIVKEEFDSEQQFLIEQNQQQIDDLKDIFVAFDIHYTNKEKDAQDEFVNVCDEIKNKNMEEKDSLRNELDKKIRELWDPFRRTTDNYDAATGERRQQVESLRDKDERSAATINEQKRKIDHLMAQIVAVKAKVGAVSKEYDEKNSQLSGEKDRLVLQFQHMKARMNQLREQQRDRLTSMSLESSDAMKKVDGMTEKAERILRFGEMCRKLETEEEKVLPFPASSLTAEERAELKEAEAAGAEDQSGEKGDSVLESWAALALNFDRGLGRFWRRFNKAELDRLATDRERAGLAAENARLRQMLKQYLDGVSLTPQVMESPNPLFVVNGRTNFSLAADTRDPRVRPAPTVQLEAAHIVKYGVTSEILFN